MRSTRETAALVRQRLTECILPQPEQSTLRDITLALHAATDVPGGTFGTRTPPAMRPLGAEEYAEALVTEDDVIIHDRSAACLLLQLQLLPLLLLLLKPLSPPQLRRPGLLEVHARDG